MKEQQMGLKHLNEVGIPDLLLKAKHIIQKRGHAHGMTVDPLNGSVDVRGAILLAAGAKVQNIQGFSPTAEEAKIGVFWVPRVEAAFEVLENIFYDIAEDIDEWNDQCTQKQVEAGLTRAANMIRTAVS